MPLDATTEIHADEMRPSRARTDKRHLWFAARDRTSSIKIPLITIWSRTVRNDPLLSRFKIWNSRCNPMRSWEVIISPLQRPVYHAWTFKDRQTLKRQFYFFNSFSRVSAISELIPLQAPDDVQHVAGRKQRGAIAVRARKPRAGNGVWIRRVQPSVWASVQSSR